MSSLTQLQDPYQRFTLRFELWLLRQGFLQGHVTTIGESEAASSYRWSWRPLLRPLFITLRALGVVLLATWLIAAMYDLGPVIWRPALLVTGAALCWVAVWRSET